MLQLHSGLTNTLPWPFEQLLLSQTAPSVEPASRPTWKHEEARSVLQPTLQNSSDMRLTFMIEC